MNVNKTDILTKIFKFDFRNPFNQTWFNYIVSYGCTMPQTTFYKSNVELFNFWGHGDYIELDNDEYVIAMEIIDDKLYYFTNKGVNVHEC